MSFSVSRENKCSVHDETSLSVLYMREKVKESTWNCHFTFGKRMLTVLKPALVRLWKCLQLRTSIVTVPTIWENLRVLKYCIIKFKKNCKYVFVLD